MNWRVVTIKGGEFASFSASKLMECFSVVHINAGAPRDVAVWQGRTTDGGLVFYFSPSASAMAPDVLAEFEATSVVGTPDFQKFNLVEL